MPSRTSVASENITAAPCAPTWSMQKPATAGWLVTPENASLPRHRTPGHPSLAGGSPRAVARLAIRGCCSACVMIASTMDMEGPTCVPSCRQEGDVGKLGVGGVAPRRPITPLVRSGMVPGGSSRSGCSFPAQAPPPHDLAAGRFGFRLMLRRVRIGTTASGASIAHATPASAQLCSALPSSVGVLRAAVRPLMRCPAKSVTPATHFTVCVIMPGCCEFRPGRRDCGSPRGDVTPQRRHGGWRHGCDQRGYSTPRIPEHLRQPLVDAAARRNSFSA